jgi:hypothetical protein
MLAAARVKATVEIIKGGTGFSLLCEASRTAAIVMIGYDPPEDESEPLFSPELAECVGCFSNVLLVSSAGGISITA